MINNPEIEYDLYYELRTMFNKNFWDTTDLSCDLSLELYGELRRELHDEFIDLNNELNNILK